VCGKGVHLRLRGDGQFVGNHLRERVHMFRLVSNSRKINRSPEPVEGRLSAVALN
jgi:hypothetical protein